MTIVASDRRKEYTGNGSTTVFSGPRAFAASHISVYLDGTLTEAYTLTGVGAANTTVTMDAAPAEDVAVLILRTVPYEQTADISNQGAYLPETLETAGLDPLAMQIQQLADTASRTLRLSDAVAGVSAALESVTPLSPVVVNADGSGFEMGSTDLTGDMLLRPALANEAQGAALVAFSQAGTGAVARTLADKAAEIVFVEDYGAAGDGVTDNTAAINAAVLAVNAAGGGVVRFGPKSYAVASQINLLAGVTLQGSGMGATRLLQTGSPSYVIQAIGSLDSAVLLTANAAQGDSTLTVASTTGISAGDYLLLGDHYAYNPLDATYVSGEMVRVYSVDSATQVTLYERVKGSMFTSNVYDTANTADVRKINMVEGVAVRDMTVVGDQATTSGLISTKYCLNPRIKDVALRDGGHYGLRLDTVRDGTVEGLVVSDLLDDIGNGHVGYGIVFAGANDGIVVTNSHFHRCRHGVTTIGGPDGYSRRITVSDSVAVGTTAAGFDTHAAGDGIKFTGLQVHASKNQGIQVRSINTEVSNCLVSRCVSHGISAGESLVWNMVVRNCTVDYPGNHGFAAEDPVDGLIIANSTFRGTGFDGIRVSSMSAGVQLLDNHVEYVGRVGTSRSGITTILDGVNAGRWLIARNFIRADSGSCAYAVYLGNLTDSWLVDNKAFGTFSSGAWSPGTNTTLRNDILT